MTTGLLICICWVLFGAGYQALRLFLSYKDGVNITIGQLVDSAAISILGPTAAIFGLFYYYSEIRSTVLVRGKKQAPRATLPTYRRQYVKPKQEVEEGAL